MAIPALAPAAGAATPHKRRGAPPGERKRITSPIASPYLGARERYHKLLDPGFTGSPIVMPMTIRKNFGTIGNRFRPVIRPGWPVLRPRAHAPELAPRLRPRWRGRRPGRSGGPPRRGGGRPWRGSGPVPWPVRSLRRGADRARPGQHRIRAGCVRIGRLGQLPRGHRPVRGRRRRGTAGSPRRNGGAAGLRGQFPWRHGTAGRQRRLGTRPRGRHAMAGLPGWGGPRRSRVRPGLIGFPGRGGPRRFRGRLGAIGFPGRGGPRRSRGRLGVIGLPRRHRPAAVPGRQRAGCFPGPCARACRTGDRRAGLVPRGGRRGTWAGRGILALAALGRRGTVTPGPVAGPALARRAAAVPAPLFPAPLFPAVPLPAGPLAGSGRTAGGQPASSGAPVRPAG